MHYLVKDIWVWSFNDVYPARIEVDCSFLSPNMSIKIGDVEKLLPYGMYLHQKYDTMRFHSVVRLTTTPSYDQRKTLISEQNATIAEERSKMQSSMLEKKKEVNAEKKVKAVPTAVVSSKFIQKEKATAKMLDRYGNEITMEEMMKKSKEGMVGKGGKAVK